MKKIVIIFFVLYFIIGLFIFRDYGVSIDEPYERNTSIVTSGYIAQRISGAATMLGLQGMNLPDMPDFTKYKDRYYGTALHYPLVLLEVINNFSLDSQVIYFIRHLNVFIFFYLSLICFYLILKERFLSYWTALLGVLFLCLFPRFFAESFYNNKDILFASCYIIAIFFSIRFYKNQSVSTAFLAAISASIALNTRIIAFFMIIVLLALFGVKMYKDKSLKEMKWLVLYSFVTFCLFMIITPGYWIGNPFVQLFKALGLFSQYPYPYPVFFMGQYFNSSSLPWYYVPVWILVSVPIFYIVLFLLGVLNKAINFTKGDNNETDNFVLSLFLLPLLSVILMKSTLYNGWRHMYFIFPPFVYFSIYSFHKIYFYCVERKKIIYKGILLFCTIVTLLDSAVWIIINHPYEFVYFNEIGRLFAAKYFEKDYWQLSQKQALEYIINNTQNDIPLVRKSYPSLLILDQPDRKRFIDAYYDKPDVYGGRLGIGGSGIYDVFGGDYYIHTYIDNQFTLLGYKTVKDFYVDGFKISSVLKCDFSYDLTHGEDIVKNISCNFHEEDAINMIDNNLDSNWSTLEADQVEFWESRDNHQEDIEITIELNNERDYNLIRLYCKQNYSPRIFTADAIFYTSTNGENWEKTTLIWKNEEDYIVGDRTYKFIKIVLPKDVEAIWKITEILFGRIDAQYLY